MKRKRNGKKNALVGMPNPVAGLSRSEAERIAAELGDGNNMGSWRTMSGEEFLKWWESSNPPAPETDNQSRTHGENR